MNERAALLKAICENPDDDTPRLVFADWLQEHGEEERAEFIRVQCEVARLRADDGRRDELVRRAGALQKRFGKRWLGELPVPDKEHIHWVEAPDWLDGETFDRGFPALLRVQNTGILVKHANVLFSATPVRRLMIWYMKRADKLAKIPQLRHLHTFRARVVARQAADDILKCPHFDSIPDVRLSFTALPEEYIERLRKKFGDRLQHQP
jgi:uncharacterized protein (TIGR02996 family)